MMDERDRQEHMEIYKLHADLADRISQRREGANRLYVSLLVGLVVLTAALLRFGATEVFQPPFLLLIGICGTALSASWFIVIRSYRQLNSAKFNVLHQLEERLVFQFFKSEWDPADQGQKSNKYWRLTVVEQSLPVIFALIFLTLVVYALIIMACHLEL